MYKLLALLGLAVASTSFFIEADGKCTHDVEVLCVDDINKGS